MQPTTDMRLGNGSAENMEGLLRTSPVLVCVVGSDDRLIETSASFAAALGYASSELSGRAASDFDCPATGTLSLTQTIASCRNQETLNGSAIAIRRKDGSILRGIALASAWKDGNGNPACGVIVIEESCLPNVKRDAEIISELRRKQDLKDEFIAVASHELRTPIQPILGLALLAKRGKINQDEAWDRVLKESRRLQQLANDILDVSRIESATLKYKMEKILLAEIVEHVVGVQKSSATADVVLKLDIGEEARNTECEADRARMTQVLMNIVGNAMKFTKKGEVLVQAKVDTKRGYYDIIVKDTAGGVPESILPKLFGKFNTQKVGEDESHGSGLGLYIARSIVAAHKGAIYVCNDNEGATFVVRLPLGPSA